MPTSQAAIDGISVHGIAWKHHLSLGGLTGVMGKMTFDTPDSEVEACAREIVGFMRPFVERLFNTSRSGADPYSTETKDAYYAARAVDQCVDDLEEAADCGLDEVRDAMTRLYDEFDYQRICVVS